MNDSVKALTVPGILLFATLAVFCCRLFVNARDSQMMEDDKQSLAKIKDAWLNTSWDAKRGLETTHYNNALVLVRAPVEEVAKALSSRAQSWEPNALGREVVVGKEAAFVFRLKGHTWTEVLCQYDFRGPPAVGLHWEQSLSLALKTRVIAYYVSGTTSSTGYELYERGELVETFTAVENNNGGPAVGQSEFFSSVRNTQLKDIKSIWTFTRRLFLDEDAFDPGFEDRYFFEHRHRQPGERAMVVNPGFSLSVAGESLLSTPIIERLDYLLFH
jgi:hypothetical protein